MAIVTSPGLIWDYPSHPHEIFRNNTQDFILIPKYLEKINPGVVASIQKENLNLPEQCYTLYINYEKVFEVEYDIDISLPDRLHKINKTFFEWLYKYELNLKIDKLNIN